MDIKEDSMKQVTINNNVFIPMPMGIIGTQYNGKANFMAAGWISRANATPPTISAGIGRHHATWQAINETGEFSVCIPGSDLLIKTDYAGIVTGEKIDKSGIFNVFYGTLSHAPLIEEAIVSLECTLVQSVDLPSNTVFIGEIQGAWADERYFDGKQIDFKSGSAFFLTMPDNIYWSFGENIGKAWSIGKDFTPK